MKTRDEELRAYRRIPLVALAVGIRQGGSPPFEWVVEHAPDDDVVGAAMRMWYACNDPSPLMTLAIAVGVDAEARAVWSATRAAGLEDCAKALRAMAPRVEAALAKKLAEHG